MSDNLKNRGPADRSRVNVNEPWEVKWWCTEFGCTETELRTAVQFVLASGHAPMVDKVQAQIKERRR